MEEIKEQKDDEGFTSFNDTFGSTVSPRVPRPPVPSTDENEEENVEEEIKPSPVTEENFYDDFDTIDWIRDATRDRNLRQDIDTELSKKNKIIYTIGRMYYGVQAWILLALVGILAALIDMAVDWLSDTRFGYCKEGFWISSRVCCREYDTDDSSFCEKWVLWSDVFGAVRNSTGGVAINYFVYFVAAMVYASLAAYFVKTFARWAAGSGISEVKTILGGFVIQGFTSAQTLLVKCVGLVLSVSSGLNLGKEGPLVHVGVCCGEIFCRIFEKYNKNPAKKREVYSAAAAAGVSVAFGAPIGGVLFSLEEVSYYFPHKTLWRTFFCATLAAIILKLINPYKTGKLVLFQVQYTHTWMGIELVPFLFIAVLGGLIGALFIKLNIKMCTFRRKSKLAQYPILEVIAVAGLTAIVSFVNPFTRGNTGEIIGALFDECDPADNGDLCNPAKSGKVILELLLACLVRLTLTIITFGVRVPAGLFIPALAIGSSMGRAIGIGVQLLRNAYADSFMFAECYEASECITPGVYALVGAAATLGGFTRMTVSLVVIIFELTGELSYILPVMLTVLVSKWVADAIAKEGIYPFLENKRDYRFTSRAYDVMTSDVVTIEQQGNTLGSLSNGSFTHSALMVALIGELLNAHRFTGYPIVDSRENMLVTGYIARQELRQAINQASELPDSTPCFFQKPDAVPNMKLDTSFKSWRRKRSNSIFKGYVDLSPWTDEAPIQVPGRTPNNTVFEMFKKLGVRYILVTDKGVLSGVITKKDILQHIAVTFRHKKRKFLQPVDKTGFSIKRLPSTLNG